MQIRPKRILNANHTILVDGGFVPNDRVDNAWLPTVPHPWSKYEQISAPRNQQGDHEAACRYGALFANAIIFL
jgi:hypothetical protein